MKLSARLFVLAFPILLQEVLVNLLQLAFITLEVELFGELSQLLTKFEAFVVDLLCLAAPVLMASLDGAHVGEHKLVHFAVVGWIGVRVVAEHFEHRRQAAHVGHHVWWNLANPAVQRVQIDWLDHLVG